MFIARYNSIGKPVEYWPGHSFAVMFPCLEKQRITHEVHQERCWIVFLQLQYNDSGLNHRRVNSVSSHIIWTLSCTQECLILHSMLYALMLQCRVASSISLTAIWHPPLSFLYSIKYLFVNLLSVKISFEKNESIKKWKYESKKWKYFYLKVS